MQVYREIPVITNQNRKRPAELTGIVSVSEGWTVARHKERVHEVIGSLPLDVPFVLDAGTGMYLNALIFDIPLAPKVPPEVRAEARRLAIGSKNPRREARRWELELVGAPERGSIWTGDLRYDANFIYLRPDSDSLSRNIHLRSSRIVQHGAEEAEMLKRHFPEPNRSVREAIGVKEMLLWASGSVCSDEARQIIATRTKKLARRQIRWFDKLARTLPDTVSFLAAEKTTDTRIIHIMHDIIGL